MRYRELGDTGLLVSEIGMGCEGFAEDECRNTMPMFDAAEELGSTISTSMPPIPPSAPLWERR